MVSTAEKAAGRTFVQEEVWAIPTCGSRRPAGPLRIYWDNATEYPQKVYYFTTSNRVWPFYIGINSADINY